MNTNELTHKISANYLSALDLRYNLTRAFISIAHRLHRFTQNEFIKICGHLRNP